MSRELYKTGILAAIALWVLIAVLAIALAYL